jgi:hypothetical protein
LTFESTKAYLDDWSCRLSQFGFVWLAPRVFPPLGCRRGIFVQASLVEIFDGRRLETGFPDYRANIQTTTFTAGGHVRVSLRGDPRGRKPFLERLTDLDEAWVMCFRQPAPGWRLFGRFIAKNVFVATCLKDRHECGSRKKYSRLAQKMISEWEQKLPILRGETWQDYLEWTVQDVDERDGVLP